MFKTRAPTGGHAGRMTTTITAITIDSADPGALASFYAKATGGKVTQSDTDYAAVEGGPVALAFQRVDGYRRPAWPAGGAHVHLELQVDDLDTARAELTALGASVPDFQPGEGSWVVLTDPEGHPFCVSAA